MFLWKYTLKVDFTRLTMPYSYKKHHLKNFQACIPWKEIQTYLFPDQQEITYFKIYL